MTKEREADVIVIGGGVAGLAAADALARTGRRVVLLEARGRLGGRVDTRFIPGWPGPVELGAEFIHGGNPDLWRMLKRAGLRARTLSEAHWLARGGAIERIPDLDAAIGRVTRLITPRKAGAMSFGGYFRRYPPAVAADDWAMARSFVEGFEAAPLDRISARSLAGESPDEEEQYRLTGGYAPLVAHLAQSCTRHGVVITLGAPVASLHWRRGHVRVQTGGSAPGTLRARAAVVTLPLGVLKARRGVGAVRFVPPLRRKQAAIDRMEVGDVVRCSVRFHDAAWRRLSSSLPPARRRDGFGFIHSLIKGMPVWWALDDRPVITGWAGGPAAKALLKLPAAGRRRRSIRSLAEILQVDPATLERGVADWQACDWTHEPFTRGAYSFIAAGQEHAAKELRSDVQGTLFFAGEATASGAEVGTVHGALSSGLRAAREVRHLPGAKRVAL